MSRHKIGDSLLEKHGLPWEASEEDLLIEMVKNGHSLRQMSDTLQRPIGGVLARMEQMANVIKRFHEAKALLTGEDDR